MSRIGKHPIAVPQRASRSTVDGNTVKVKGPKGELVRARSTRHDGRRRKTDARRRARRRMSESQVASRPDAHARREHGRGRDEGIQKQLEIVGRRIQGGGASVRTAARARLLAPGRVQGAEGHQAQARRSRRRSSSKARTRKSSDRSRRRFAVFVHPSRTRARASSTPASRFAVRPVRREASNGKDGNTEVARAAAHAPSLPRAEESERNARSVRGS